MEGKMSGMSGQIWGKVKDKENRKVCEEGKHEKMGKGKD